jgi:hypothetical protein
LVPLLSDVELLDSCNKTGSILPLYRQGVWVGSSAHGGVGDWPPWNTNLPVAQVPSMRSPRLLNKGKPLVLKGFAFGCFWRPCILAHISQDYHSMYLDIIFPNNKVYHNTVLDGVPPKPRNILEFLDDLVVLFKLPGRIH